MKSSPVFNLLKVTLIELEYALADFRFASASLSESLNFVGLEKTLLNLTSAIRRVLEPERAAQISIDTKLKSKDKLDGCLGAKTTPPLMLSHRQSSARLVNQQRRSS